MAPSRTKGKDTDERSVRQGPAPDPTQALSAAIATFDEEFKSLKLAGKLATIAGHLGRIPKNGHNNFNNYDYVLESDLVEWVKYWLAAARILIYPTIREWRVEPGPVRDNRSGDPRTDVLYVFHVIDGYTGEEIVTEALGQGSDPRDKGANKASTSAMKFAYMRLFNIASGEESEGDEKGDARDALGSTEVPQVVVTASTVEGAQRGGHQATASGAQIKAISNMSNQLGLGAEGLVKVMERVINLKVELPEAEAQHSAAIRDALVKTSGEDAGKLIVDLQRMIEAAKAAPSTDEPA